MTSFDRPDDELVTELVEHIAIPSVSRDADAMQRAARRVEPTECFPNLCAALVKRNWSDEDIRLVLGGNIRRVLGEVWQ